jgi:GntR family histidine utilization transcriptional repressor
MVRDFGVSRMTVNRAFRELAAEGLITRTQGLGSFSDPIDAESGVIQFHCAKRQNRLNYYTR